MRQSLWKLAICKTHRKPEQENIRLLENLNDYVSDGQNNTCEFFTSGWLLLL